MFTYLPIDAEKPAEKVNINGPRLYIKADSTYDCM